MVSPHWHEFSQGTKCSHLKQKKMKCHWKKLLDKMGKCYHFVSGLILLFFQKNFKWQCHQDTKKVTTILMHHSKSQFWGKNKKMKKMNFAQNSFFLFVFQACKVLFAWKLLLDKFAKKASFVLQHHLLWNKKMKMISKKKQRSPKFR